MSGRVHCIEIWRTRTYQYRVSVADLWRPAEKCCQEFVHGIADNEQSDSQLAQKERYLCISPVLQMDTQEGQRITDFAEASPGFRRSIAAHHCD